MEWVARWGYAIDFAFVGVGFLGYLLILHHSIVDLKIIVDKFPYPCISPGQITTSSMIVWMFYLFVSLIFKIQVNLELGLLFITSITADLSLFAPKL